MREMTKVTITAEVEALACARCGRKATPRPSHIELVSQDGEPDRFHVSCTASPPGWKWAMGMDSMLCPDCVAGFVAWVRNNK